MRLFLEFFLFELKIRFRSISTYVYFGIWFFFSFLCVASENFGAIGFGNGKVLLNGPYANISNDISASFFGIIIVAAIFGTSILRDFQRDTTQILFTKPISKFAYLGGRWLGSFVVTVFVFFALIPGEMAGTLAPWADHTRIAHAPLIWYFQPFLSIVVVQIFFLGSLFFLVGALSRRVFIVYLEGAAFLALYLFYAGAFLSTRSLNRFWPGIFDPVGILFSDGISRYWTVVDKNTLLFSWSSHIAQGLFLYNRLVWSGIGILAMAALWLFFPMSLEALTARVSSRRARLAAEQDEEIRSVPTLVTTRAPLVHQMFGPGTTWAQYWSLTRLRMRNIVRDIPFWVLLILMAGLSCSNGRYAGKLEGENVWPVTYLMLQAVEGIAILFFYIIAAFYAAELIWRERDTHFEGIHDSLPVGETTDWLSKLTALCFVEFAVLAVAGLCGIFMQAVQGYYHFELLQYFKELYIVTFPQVLVCALLAMFVQTVVSNKFFGHAIVIGVFVLDPILFNFGWENTLYLFGQTPPYTYSDMNGYGHFVLPLFWSITYWLAIAAFLGVLSIGLARRGAEDSLRARLRVFRQSFRRIAPALAVCLAVAVGSGVWYYYNAHVLNEYLTAKDRRDIQAEYEKDFKKYEHLAQPKIVAVDAAIDIYPDRRSFSGTGHFVLQNKTPQPISQIHITNAQQGVSHVVFDRPFHVVSSSPRAMYTIYALDKPLAPGETMNMNFNVGYTSRGFKDGNERAELAYNGTFFDSGYFPTIGYDQGLELSDPRRRREEHLGPQELLPKRGDPLGSVTNLFTADSDWIGYKTTVSTSAEQIALAPGYLQKDWIAKGRHYFTYDMGLVKTLDFYAYVSGKYQVTRDTYQGVNGPIAIEVYHLPQHSFDVPDMIAAAKAGLAFYQKDYSPYQFRQYRIIEFPRYRSFAQSFPNTVPFSEGIGFIERMEKPTDIDFTYFVTAHELAHQWWGHQLIGARVAGSNMMSETLAEYSALMTMQHRYGAANMHKFLRYELDRYLRGRGAEVRREEPLAQVQQEAYVWYQKGGQVMYTLADYIGEDKVDLALHNFLMQYRYANASDAQSGPYPDTRELVAALRAQTPADLQYYIDDSFENIVLYDNKAVSASVTRTPDHKYKVTLVVEAHKVRSDGSGNETPMPMHDLIDIGVMAGPRDAETPLYLKKEWIGDGRQTFTIVVDRMPTRAGIDPYNKLIDRNEDDNEIDVVKQ
ncbi:MAG TPA: M1 family aminopeptidase [Acidobacteriaceae bacterium]|nr:M1 family aminopeptidase [Acidobacteriaceae bacterium]